MFCNETIEEENNRVLSEFLKNFHLIFVLQDGIMDGHCSINELFNQFQT